MRRPVLLLPAVVLAACTLLAGEAPAPAPLPAPTDVADGSARRAAGFAARCAQPGVVRCVSFDEASQFVDLSAAAVGSRQGRGPMGLVRMDPSGPPPQRDCEVAAGGCSLRFTVASRSGPGAAGSWFLNFSDDFTTRFGEGETFHVQWRQRFSPEFLRTRYDGDGWKQIIVGEGDRPGYAPDGRVVWSCTQLELVVSNLYLKGYPQMYHSCGGKDGQYEPLPTHGVQPYEPDQWMTFQMRVQVGTWYRNDRRYHRDSTVELWVAKEGGRSRRAVLARYYDLANTEADAKYGKLWLLPYHTNKNEAQEHPAGFTWYDELIVSRAPIPDP